MSHILLGTLAPDLLHLANAEICRLSHIGTIPRQPIRVVDYYPYKRGEGPYATFQFFYRSQGEFTHVTANDAHSDCPR